MNVRANKSGIAFGKFAETDNVFDVGMNSIFRGTLSARGSAYMYGLFGTGTMMHGNGNSAAYMRIATLTVTGGYVNGPIEIRYYQRGSITATSLYVRFQNTNSTDPSVDAFNYEGWCRGAYIAKTATSTWDIFIAKSEPWEDIGIQYWAHYGVGVGITYRGENYTSLPSGYITAMSLYANMMWPVDSVYITYNNNNPGNFIGGTWERFGQGRVLVGQGTGNDGRTSRSFASGGDTGGEYEHTLTISEMPSHRHNITMPMSTVWNSNGGAGFQLDSTIEATETYTDKIGFTGGESSHNNIQPYITVYFWKRIS